MAQTSILAGGAPSPNMGVTPPSQAASGSREYPATGFFPGPMLPGTPTIPSGTSLAYASAGALATAITNGLVVPGRGNFITVQSEGVVKLTTEEWDVIAGTSGGLATGQSYYVSDTGGRLNTYAQLALAHGLYIALVGLALSATELQLQLSGASPAAKTP